MDTLNKLANRFNGVTLECRRACTNWPGKWRAYMTTTKNERADYRLTVYGESAEAVLDSLSRAVDAVDQAPVLTDRYAAPHPCGDGTPD